MVPPLATLLHLHHGQKGNSDTAHLKALLLTQDCVGPRLQASLLRSIAATIKGGVAADA